MKLFFILIALFGASVSFADAPPAAAPAETRGAAESASGREIPQNEAEAAPSVAQAADAKPAEGAAGLIESLEEDLQSAGGTEDHELSVLQRLGIAAGIVLLQCLLIWGLWVLFRWLAAKLQVYGEKHFKPIVIKKFNLFSKAQIQNGCAFLLRIIKYAVSAFQLFITFPIVFRLFEVTKRLASTLFGYILAPLESILFGIIGYIPNLFTIAIILFVMRYVLRTLRYFTMGLEKGKLKLAGFYPEWAQPTFNILRVLLYAFTVAIIYPYLPGSDSAIFQGVSVFVGIIFSLGSSSAVGNLVAGLVITYMRPFKIGDRIKLGEVTGFVVEKSPIIIRLRTHKNEYVTFPNIMVLNSITVNYNTSEEMDEEGLLLHAEVTMNYAVPWPRMHEILINAARKTSHTEKTPKPFVLQTALDDYYCRYEINVYTKAVGKVPAIYSELYQHLQDGFAEAGIDLTAPAYQIRLSERNARIIPGEPPPRRRKRRGASPDTQAG